MARVQSSQGEGEGFVVGRIVLRLTLYRPSRSEDQEHAVPAGHPRGERDREEDQRKLPLASACHDACGLDFIVRAHCGLSPSIDGTGEARRATSAGSTTGPRSSCAPPPSWSVSRARQFAKPPAPERGTPRGSGQRYALTSASPRRGTCRSVSRVTRSGIHSVRVSTPRPGSARKPSSTSSPPVATACSECAYTSPCCRRHTEFTATRFFHSRLRVLRANLQLSRRATPGPVLARFLTVALLRS